MIFSKTHYMKLSKIKDKVKILKAAKEKEIVIYKGIPIKLSVYFSSETLQARRAWNNIFKVLKRKKKQNLPMKNTLSGKAILQN